MFLTLLVAFSPGQAGDVEAEITRLSKAYDSALKALDVEMLGRLFDDDGQFVLPDGRLMDKTSYIARLASEQVTYETAESVIGSIRVFGETAIESGTWTSTGTEGGTPRTVRERYTAVWVKKAGRWVMTAEQVTPIAEGQE